MATNVIFQQRDYPTGESQYMILSYEEPADVRPSSTGRYDTPGICEQHDAEEYWRQLEMFREVGRLEWVERLSYMPEPGEIHPDVTVTTRHFTL